MATNEEYNNTDVPKGQQEDHEQYISDRGEQLYGLQLRHADNMLRHLFLVNAGGAIAILSYLGTDSDKMDVICAKLSLLFFTLGIVFVGVVRAILLHRSFDYFELWQSDTEKYFKQEISWQNLVETDDSRTKGNCWEFRFGYISAGCFIIGCICGALGF
ncbi:MAG TPA: hypothetical protein ENH94_04090 [Phycisphaerales bacterium]|nr:hypothetical protein [Phycisphaerales bacterium]